MRYIDCQLKCKRTVIYTFVCSLRNFNEEFKCFISISLQQFSVYYTSTMKPKDKPATKTATGTPKRRKMDECDPKFQQKQQKVSSEQDYASQEESESSSSEQDWANQVIQPAIKTMNFRKKRGTRMKQLMKGRPKNDAFWNRYQGYFGGGLDEPEDEDDQEDYEASSSGRDEFDSDFDLTDSYAGKRGRKKGSKVKRKQRKANSKANQKTAKGKKKQSSEEGQSEKKESGEQQKIQHNSRQECVVKIDASTSDVRKKKMDVNSQQQENADSSLKVNESSEKSNDFLNEIIPNTELQPSLVHQ